MKASKFSEAQIAFVLRQAEEGTAVGEVCRKAGISEATFYNWRKKYAGLMPSEMKRLKQLEEENGKLKKLVADLSLDKAMLQDVLAKKAVRPARRRALVDEVRAGWKVSIRRACRVLRTDTLDLSLQGQACLAGRADQAHQGDCRDARALRLPPDPCAAEAGGLGGECQADLSSLQEIGPATAEQDAEAAGEGEAARRPAPGGPGQRDMGHGLRARSAGDRAQDPGADDGGHVHAVLAGDRAPVQLPRRRTWSRCSSGSAASIGFPKAIRVDQGTEFVSRDLDLWAYQRGVTLDFSRPGKPTDNAFIESLNGKFRAECLNAHWFMSLDDARAKCEAWRRDYNEVRPHSAIGNKPPITLVNRSGDAWPSLTGTPWKRSN